MIRILLLVIFALSATAAAAQPGQKPLFASSAISQKPARGYIEMTLAEYLPVSQAARAGVSSGAAPPAGAAHSRPGRSASSRPLARPLGSRCDACGELVTERALLTSVYIGCRCG